MKSQMDVKVTAGLAIIIFGLMAVFKGSDFSKDLVSLISSAISWTVIVRLLFVKWAWKWKLFKILERLHKVPNLEGKWKGQFNSTGNSNTPSDRLNGKVEVEICQPDIHTIKVVRKSDESTSRSFGEMFEVSDDGLIHFTYSYVSEPKATVRDRSPISYGTVRLVLSRTPALALEGNYWTDQKTTGTYNLKKTK
ncbi:hypothetical protein [Bdellovibrio sp. ArHS]|uniref:Cap15 family cyclic dinucleotide receptor domain-containing protein n=1 Tax=Bdellovibrio sp. ArHS TaxID=1569284 RepID=UPI0025C13388|nr:hypothetical protein [Bdellovibrio sp. ArHS]